MARIRSTIFSNRELPRITTPATYGRQPSRRRNALRSEWSMGQMGYTVYESEGSGYELPSARIMPFSTNQSLVKLWPEWAE